MKPRWHIHIPAKHLVISLGWFGGEPFKLFSVTLLEISREWWTLLDIQIAKLTISISIDMET